MHRKNRSTKKNLREKGLRRIVAAISMMLLGTAMFVMPAMAATVNASTMMGNLISLMCSMFKYVGVALFVWAIIQFILATKRSDADSKSDAIQTGVCGIALMSVALIVTAMNLTNAIGSGTINDDMLDNLNGAE